jgi:hypothetical protein
MNRMVQDRAAQALVCLILWSLTGLSKVANVKRRLR